mgnify:FL=1
MNKRMIVEYSGWLECDPDKTLFYYLGPERLEQATITGRQYMTLPEEEQQYYVLECLGQAYQYQENGELQECTIEIEEVKI